MPTCCAARTLYIVFLRRRNLLAATVSGLIAEQTGLWAAWDRDRALQDYYTDLAPLPVQDVREKLRQIKENIAEMAAILSTRSDGRVLELYYEDLFLSQQSTRWRLVESLYSHLGLPPCENPRIGHFLENAAFRMGQPATYGRLPNLAEIEATFGNDDTGHIGYLAPDGPGPHQRSR